MDDTGYFLIFLAAYICCQVVAVILIVKFSKKAAKRAREEHEKRRYEYKERFLNNPIYHKIMDRCVRLHMDFLLDCVHRRNSKEIFTIAVHYGDITLLRLSELRKRITYREYDMENFDNLDMLMAFMDASKECLGQKVLDQLKAYDISNCRCSVSCSTEENHYYVGDELKTSKHYYIEVECNFSYHLNEW